MALGILATLGGDMVTRADICVKTDKLKLSSVTNKASHTDLITDWSATDYIALKCSEII